MFGDVVRAADACHTAEPWFGGKLVKLMPCSRMRVLRSQTACSGTVARSSTSTPSWRITLRHSLQACNLGSGDA